MRVKIYFSFISSKTKIKTNAERFRDCFEQSGQYLQIKRTLA